MVSHTLQAARAPDLELAWVLHITQCTRHTLASTRPHQLCRGDQEWVLHVTHTQHKQLDLSLHCHELYDLPTLTNGWLSSCEAVHRRVGSDWKQRERNLWPSLLSADWEMVGDFPVPSWYMIWNWLSHSDHGS